MKLNVSIVTSKWFWIALGGIAVLAVIIVIRSATVQALLAQLTPPDVPEVERPATRVVLEHNWAPEVTERFHYVSQGTSTLPIPYEWLIALEQPEGSAWGLLVPGAKDLFMDGAYQERFGFISVPNASAGNPDGLPIGFNRTPFQTLPGYPELATSVGFTCAACHTGRFTHGDTEFIVNGGPATIDLDLFSKALGASLGQTVLASTVPLPNARFKRFAKRVLGDSYDASTSAALAKNLTSIVQAQATLGDVIDVTEGFGRLDALNRIGNQVFAKNTGRRDNYQAINAPVNYPHIWTASWFDWVQYDGSIMQPLVRNAGEALGVHANIDTTAPVGAGRFSSSLPLNDLRWIEDQISGDSHPMQTRQFRGLHGPTWPAEQLGAIDAGLADEGRALYAKHCQGCHLPPLDSAEIFSDRYFKKITWFDSDGQQQETPETFLKLRTIKLGKIGTDSAQAEVLLKRRVNTAAVPAKGFDNMGIKATVCTVGPAPEAPTSAASSLSPAAAKPSGKALIDVDISDGPMLNFALALGSIVQQADEAWFDANLVPEDARAAFEGDRPNCLRAGAGYKARPLNGVWATGPFLHNGSVPTLDDLLRPVAERPRFVRLGNLEFDPVKVGVAQPDLSDDSYPAYEDGTFILDTARAGNRNTGHAFGGDGPGVIGPAFSDRERAAIIEFLKTL